MTSNTADISNICEFGWYDWIMFRDNSHTFPDLKMTLGCYLGLATIIDSALTAKLLQANDTFACRPTFCHLTDQTTHCATHICLRPKFDASIGDILGRPACDDYFPAENLTPDHDHYDPTHKHTTLYQSIIIAPRVFPSWLDP